VQGKGLSEASDLVSGIIMPTPSAMLTAMELLSDGWEELPGIGELVGVDLGGATTDIYSIAEGSPANMGTVMKGIQEPYAKRSVEGDIGMRYSVHGILEAVGDRRLSKIAGINRQKVNELVDYLSNHTDYIPDNEEMEKMDYALACEQNNVWMIFFDFPHIPFCQIKRICFPYLCTCTKRSFSGCLSCKLRYQTNGNHLQSSGCTGTGISFFIFNMTCYLFQIRNCFSKTVVNICFHGCICCCCSKNLIVFYINCCHLCVGASEVHQ
jgi:hypothetical protein